MGKLADWIREKMIWPYGGAEEEKSTPSIDERRASFLVEIARTRLQVASMADRPRQNDEKLDGACFERLKVRLTEIESLAGQIKDLSEFDNLQDLVNEQYYARAYLCPSNEIKFEGDRALQLMEWWGIPGSETKKLKGSYEKLLNKAPENASDGRGALRSIYEELEEWGAYRDEYEKEMKLRAHRIFWVSLLMVLLAASAFYYSAYWGPLLAVGFLFAGVAGGGVSVVTKLPGMNKAESEKSDSYDRQIYGRVLTGAAASLVGCGFLVWGIVSVNLGKWSFSDWISGVCKGCTTEPPTQRCVRALVLLAVPVLLGYSERGLAPFEQNVFGRPTKSREE